MDFATQVTQRKQNMQAQQTLEKDAVINKVASYNPVMDGGVNPDEHAYTKAEKKAAKSRVLELVERLQEFDKRKELNFVVTDHEMAKRKLLLIKSYGPDYEICKKVGLLNAEVTMVGQIITDSVNALQLQKTDTEHETDSLVSTIGVELGENEKENHLSPDIDATLSSKTLEGVRDIDRWMLRNMYKAGATKDAFVFSLLSMSARERLYIYYVVENKRRHNPGLADVATSQLNYVPNLDAFKKQIIASGWRFTKRFTGEHIYWEKLSDASNQLVGIRDKITGYSKIDQNKQPLGDEEKINQECLNMERIENLGEQDVARKQEIRQFVGRKNDLTIERNNALVDFIKKLETYKKLQEKSDGAWVWKNSRRSAAMAAAASAQNALRILLNADNALEQHERRGVVPQDNTVVQAGVSAKLGEATEGFSKMQYTTEVFGDAYQAASVLQLTNSSNVSYNYMGLNQTILADVNIGSGALSGVTGITTLISFIYGVYAFCKSASSLSGADIASNVSKLSSALFATAASGYGTYSSITSATAIAQSTLGVADEATKKALGAAGKVATTVGIVTSSVAMGANAISMICTGVNMSRCKTATAKLKDKRDMEAQQRSQDEEAGNVETELEKKTRLRKEHFEDNIRRHQEQMNKNSMKSSATSFAASACLLGSTFTAAIPPLALAFSGVSIGLSIFNSIREGVRNRRERIRSVDDYLGLNSDAQDSYVEKAYTLWTQNPRNATKFNAIGRLPDGKKEKAIKELKFTIKESLRKEMIANLGFADVKSFYSHVCSTYAGILYDNAFTDGANGVVSEQDAWDSNSQYYPYVMYIHSLGLSVKYENNTWLPTKATITAKMIG